jgi:hypothetical protein
MSGMSAAATWRRIALFGFLVWLIPFVIAFFLFTPEGTPRVSQEFFDSVMAVSLAVVTAYFSYRLFAAAEDVAASGLMVGLAWLAVSVTLDMPTIVVMFETPLVEYALGVALSYLMIPAITVAVAKTARARHAGPA